MIRRPETVIAKQDHQGTHDQRDMKLMHSDWDPLVSPGTGVSGAVEAGGADEDEAVVSATADDGARVPTEQLPFSCPELFERSTTRLAALSPSTPSRHDASANQHLNMATT